MKEGHRRKATHGAKRPTHSLYLALTGFARFLQTTPPTAKKLSVNLFCWCSKKCGGLGGKCTPRPGAYQAGRVLPIFLCGPLSGRGVGALRGAKKGAERARKARLE